MPIYEYRCFACGGVESRLARMGESGQLLECRSCGHLGLEKLFSVFASPKSPVTSTLADLPSQACHGCGESRACHHRKS